MTNGEMGDLKKLHELGFALHWLKPKSKAPVESGWTSGPRLEWAAFAARYKKGLNVGTRLGLPLQLNRQGYLGVIDVDVKHAYGHAAALEFFKGLKVAPGPWVRSGRGGGSGHFYFLSLNPIKPRRLAQSPNKEKIYMPSVAPTKHERETLTSEEIAQGLRLRPSWEISLMGEGQQVVLPPSIHPDSGQAYKWGMSPLTAEIPYWEPPATTSSNSPQQLLVPTSFAPVAVYLAESNLPNELVDMITSGAGSKDRSAELFVVAIAMIKEKFTDQQILSVLTDPDNYLGLAAYDHAKTRDRARAAAWVAKYTLPKAHIEAAVSDFGEYTAAEPLSEEAAAAQAAEIITRDLELEGYYTRGARGALKPNYDALLKRFEQEFPHKTIADMKSVFVFNGTHYKDFTPIEAKAFAEKHFNPKPEEKYRTEFWNKILATNVERRSFFFDTTESKINFKNGVLDLETPFLGLDEHSPEYGFRACLPYDYDADATCPVFEKWLNGIMLGDRALVALIQEFMGYIVRGGEYKYHKALWLGGTGRNGKSTFIDVLKALIGVSNFSTISIKALVSDRFAGSELDGKIANFSEETSPQELADSGPFKNLTGDGELSVQKKFGDAYILRNRAKLVMTYNQIPDLKDLSKGMLSRPIIIPFRKTIDDAEQDRNIKKKLFRELSGIFNFALAGWDRLESNGGFTASEVSAEALQKVTDESCNVYQWVENYVEFDGSPTRHKPVELYNAYKANERYPYRTTEFYRRLNNHPRIKAQKKRVTTGIIYEGLKVL